MMDKFIEENKRIWKKFKNKTDTKGLLLIEPELGISNTHSNGVIARILKEAKGYNTAWLDIADDKLWERVQSYDEYAIRLVTSELNIVEKWQYKLVFKWHYYKLKITKNVMGLKLGGIPFGDTLYDTYLQRKKYATLREIDEDVLNILNVLIYNYFRYKKTLKINGISALLITHNVLLSDVILQRLALKMGINVYSSIEASVRLQRTLKDMKRMPIHLDRKDFDYLKSIPKEVIIEAFDKYLVKRIKGETDIDAQFAFGTEKKTFKDRLAFTNEYGLNPGNKNVFVMLHAFNDYPHSSQDWIAYKDYYEWFKDILKIAELKKDVNWIFKEHPSSIIYPTHDIVLSDHFKDCDSHIIFLDKDESFNSASLLHVADVILTCIGTAGVEYPAAVGIPSIVAGASWYSGFGFTIDCKSKAEYVNHLMKIEQVPRLDEQKQFDAKVVFIFLFKFYRVEFEWAPDVSWEFYLGDDKKLEKYFYEQVIELYKHDYAKLSEQYDTLVEEFKKDDFVRTKQPIFRQYLN